MSECTPAPLGPAPYIEAWSPQSRTPLCTFNDLALAQQWAASREAIGMTVILRGTE